MLLFRIRVAACRLALALALASFRATASAAGPLADPLSTPSPEGSWEIRHAPDRLVVELSPAAASIARAARARAGVSVSRTGIAALDRFADLVGARLEPEFRNAAPPGPADRFPDLTRFWIARFDDPDVTSSARAALAALPEVAGVESPAILPVTLVANDSLWNKSWYFFQTNRRDIHAPEAWDRSLGEGETIAILDTGVLPYHPDLGGTTPGSYGKLFRNAAEDAGAPGVDDDGNGFVDDVSGWDFVALTSQGTALAGEDWQYDDNDPNDFAFHGTAVAGAAAAMTFNGVGVAGTAPAARLLPARVGWASTAAATGEVDLTFAAQALVYSADMGATVINISFATTNQTDLLAALQYALARGVVVVTASGNNGTPHYLSDQPNVVTAAATDNADRVTAFSNRGSFVDLCAPGYLIATTSLQIPRVGTDSLTMRQPGYTAGATGTSFAAPIAAGTAALVQSWRKAHGLAPLSSALMELRLSETTDDISNLNSLTNYGSGRINAQRAISDPPTSFPFAFGGRTVGSPLVLRMYDGTVRAACVTDAGAYLLLDATTGDTLVHAALPGIPAGALAMADLGPGLGRGLFVALEDGRIAGLSPGGDALAGWPVVATTVTQLSGATPSLGDLDGDGVTDVVWGGDDGRVYAWTALGERRAGFPRTVGGPARNVLVALSDLDGAPGVEIAATTANGSLHVLRGTGIELAGFPVTAGLAPGGPIVISARADTSDPRIVVASNYEIRSYDRLGGLAFDVASDGFPNGALAAGDLTGSALDEIVFPNSNGQAGLTLLQNDGTRIVTKRFNAVRGPVVIGGLAANGRNAIGVAVNDAATEAFAAYDAALAAVRGFVLKRGASSYDVSLDDSDDDGATELLAGSRDGISFWVYDAGRGTRGAADPWPMAGANPGRTSSRLYAPPNGTLDAEPPSTIADLRARVVSHASVTLDWSAPADAGPVANAARYEMRIAPYELTSANFATGALVPLAAPRAPGADETIVIPGLAENGHYWIALRTRDAAGNWSACSTPLEIVVGRSFPAPVTDLRIAATSDTSLTLRWTATGDDGLVGRPARYRVRLSNAPITNAGFDALALGADVAATVSAGGAETLTIGGLDAGARWFAALRAEDDEGGWSLLSNVANTLLGRFASDATVALAPRLVPSAAPVEFVWQGDASPGIGAELRVLDIAGRVVGRVPLAGAGGLARWDGRAPAGVYFAELRSGARTARTRFVLLR